MGCNKGLIEQLFLTCRARGFPLSPAIIAREVNSLGDVRDYTEILEHLRRTHRKRATKRNIIVKTTQCQQTSPLQLIPETGKVDIPEEYFATNLAHINYLMVEVRYWVAAAWLRLKSVDDIGSRREDFSFLGLDPGITTAAILDRSIQLKGERKNTMEQNSIQQQGVQLRFPELVRKYGLNEFEQKVLQLLIVSETSLDLKSMVEQCDIDFWNSGFRGASMEIGAILSVLCENYEEQLRYRGCFSIGRPLVKYELISLARMHLGFLETDVAIHERISQFCLDDHNVYDMELRCIISAYPTTRLDQVILDEQVKNDLVRYIESFLNNQKTENSLIRSFGYGTGLTCLFYGLSGTGKTMLAHGLANHLGCRLLSLNIGGLGYEDISFEDAIKHVFREARLSGGIVFLDECDDLLRDNSRMSRAFLIEIEKAECITILATNKTVKMDPAMDRRINLKTPFSMPDEKQRLAIWRTLLPEDVLYGEDIDLKQLAARYLFTGGLIKNSLLMATGNAAMQAQSAQSNQVVLTHDEICKAARHQATSMFDLGEQSAPSVPGIRLSDLPLRACDLKKLQHVACSLPGLLKKELGLCGLISTDDIQSGEDVAAGIAEQNEMMLRRFSLDRLFDKSKSTDSETDRIVHPLTQQSISLLEYVFVPRPGQQEILLLVDDTMILPKLLEPGKTVIKEWVRFKKLLHNHRGVLFVVSASMKSDLVPLEFSFHLCLRHPSEDRQIQAWQDLFPDIPENAVVKLVEEYPLHGREIDLLARQAEISAMLNGKTHVDASGLGKLVRRLHGRQTTPLLFGKERY